MNTAIKHARFLKYGLLGITLATAAYITQTTSFSSNAATLTTSNTTVQVMGLDAPNVRKLWSDYEAVFLAQEKAINQAFTEVETATVEIDKLVAAIDRDMLDFLANDVKPSSMSAPILLGFAAPH